MSDQTEKPKDVLPKGYDVDTPSTEVVRQKKFAFRTLFTVTPTDQDQREKDLQEYEASYLARVEKEVGYKPEESSDSLRVDLEISTESTDDLGKLNLSKHTVTKRKKYLAERVEYEQRYLSRYKEPKGKPSKKSASKIYKLEPKPKRDMKKERKEYERKFLARYKGPKESKRSSNPKYGDDLGRLNLRKHTVTKRKEYLANRKDYEAKYIQRYVSKQKSKPKRSSGKKLDHDLISGRLNLREYVDKKRKELHVERNVYEQKYLARYKQANAKAKKSGSTSVSGDDLGRLNLRKHTVTKRKKYLAERAEYEKKYLARYKQPKSKPRKTNNSSLYKPEKPKPKRDMKKERQEYEKQYLTRYQTRQKTKRKKKK